ncbi:four-carbon acid sugar kinase family protein [Geosporobacter ferrireducens]|uniref:Hydroxyacid dehydrogenase n=1 Tax=Geosporobacter ferrireducens TaxID=1424294 RepID=A0A1D8GMM1_9FIRM|nr:four-carbon acid sugar kinase family protein [Geosporobacter ferrireducens]AOT72082.1 hydroxyacid dehydrogenase [Geosporobacter ferrireducens]MTI55966.1 hydroxyacid dehydrogenase [Geosporobacter ferrireducens]
MEKMMPIGLKVLDCFKIIDETFIHSMLESQLNKIDKKIIVLDDDPTGIQTVHGISVYTDWTFETICQGLGEQNRMFFILTNSRAFTIDETTKVHREIAQNISLGAKKMEKDFLIISRGDSTLRGHYPLETQILRDEVTVATGKVYDGEIIIPFFKEGGRFTIDNIHYVKEGDRLVPTGQTEFAKDKSFGYYSSHLGDFVEEKTQGQYKRQDCIYITLEELRDVRIDEITEKLVKATNFNKIIVNAVDYIDVKVFAIAWASAVLRGKEFIFRGAAAITKVLGGILDKPLLKKEELVVEGYDRGGLIIVGSYVNKTTLQMEELRNCSYPIAFIEFNQHLALQLGGLEKEVKRVIALAEAEIINGRTVTVYTRRERLDLDTDDKDKQLKISVEISEAITRVVEDLTVQPRFIIAKGGITSSDVGTKALRVKRALVMGQIQPGIPVWMTGEESKFPGMPYIIFPGNVGEVSTLRETVESLMG